MNKSNTIKCLCLLVAFVFAGFGAKAQLTHLEQSFYLNFNLPVGEFADDATSTAGGVYIPMTRYEVGKAAIAGVGLGYRASYRFDVGFGEVSPYIGVDFNWNQVQSKIRDQYDDVDGSKVNYFNLPIFFGINYRYQLTDIFTPFAEFGLGPDFMFITKESAEIVYPALNINQAFELKYKASGTFAWQIGIGTYFGEHVSVGFHYNGYGKHAIKYTDNTTVPVGDLNPKVQKRNIGLLSLRVGFHF